MNLTADENRYSVSVVIPAYNIEAYLARALDSVLAQTQPPDEIIVVDDGSTDQTAAVAQRYGSQVRYIYQENAGLSAARNTGIRNATCTWIALLDGDDEWLPDKLRLQVDLLRRNPHLVWACANCYFHWVHLNKRVIMHEPDSMTSLMAGREYLDDYLIAANQDAVGNSDTMIIKRQVLIEAGLFREGLTFNEDHDMWWRIAYRRPQYGYLPQPLAIYYHNRPGSLTHCVPRNRQIDVLCELLDRHLMVAATYGRSKELRIRFAHYLTWLLPNLLEEQNNMQVLRLLHLFGYMLGRRSRIVFRLKATFPVASTSVLYVYNWLKRNIIFRRNYIRALSGSAR